jgi:hypothetical protein
MQPREQPNRKFSLLRSSGMAAFLSNFSENSSNNFAEKDDNMTLQRIANTAETPLKKEPSFSGFDAPMGSTSNRNSRARAFFVEQQESSQLEGRSGAKEGAFSICLAELDDELGDRICNFVAHQATTAKDRMVVHDLFLFRAPNLFFFVVQRFNMLLSLYMSLWLILVVPTRCVDTVLSVCLSI